MTVSVAGLGRAPCSRSVGTEAAGEPFAGAAGALADRVHAGNNSSNSGDSENRADRMAPAWAIGFWSANPLQLQAIEP